MLRFRTLLLLAVASALVLVALLASWSPALGQDQLRRAPLTIGALFLGLWVVSEVLWRASVSRTARALSTLGISAAAVLVLLRLRIGFFTPAVEREFETWHLWTMFTAVNMAVVSVPLLTLSALMEAVTRFAGRPPRSV